MKKNAEVHFISRNLEGNLHGKITHAGFSLHVLPRHPIDKSLKGYAAWLTVPQNVDVAETNAVLREFGKVDRLVVDSYAIDITWEREMRSFVDEIFVIDDLANRKHDCDILLDQNFYLDKEVRYVGLVPEDCKLLLGPRHALLREEFYEAREHLSTRNGRLQNILVFYGGSDLTNETMKALHALRVFHEMKPEMTVDVIVGTSNPHQEKIQAFCDASDVRDWITYHCQVNNMADYMERADLALGAGGSTTWERCFLGLPAIVTAVAENQEKTMEDCAAAGYITYLGQAPEVTVEQIVSALCSATGQRLAVQRGRMRELFEDKKRLALRKVAKADAETLFRWRNDPDTRANSFQTDPISYEEHVEWLESTLRNPAQKIFILCEGDTLIGQVRLSMENDMATISYSIDAAYRAQGYGKVILQLAENHCVERGTTRILRGYVKKKNIASQVIFETLGYECEEAPEKNCYLYVKNKLQYKSLDKRQIAGGGILLLTNNRNALAIYEWLRDRGENVELYSGRLSPEMLERLCPYWVISYNYSHIVGADVIESLRGRIVNLHASFLPWNRGASPNFWSFVENTPKGVSIHFMDEGLDTGDLIAQEKMFFNEEEETFRSSYQTLNEQMIRLFCRVWPQLSEGKLVGRKQEGIGSIHTMKDFETLLGGEPMDWDMNVAVFKRRLRARGILIADS